MTSAEWNALPPLEKAAMVLKALIAYADRNHWGLYSDERGWLSGHAMSALNALSTEPLAFEALAQVERSWPGVHGCGRTEYRRYADATAKNGYYAIVVTDVGRAFDQGPFVTQSQAEGYLLATLQGTPETKG